MDITVILCTYNRCYKLRTALASLAVSILPCQIQWEVLVVDNNSTDETHAVVEEFIRRYPDRFRYLFEPKQGKSNALNSGIQSARGQVLAFVDDDVIVSPAWLCNLTAPIDGGTIGGVGGRVLLQQDVEAPKWLPLEGAMSLAGMLTVFDLGEESHELTVPPFGTNMAFRRSLFKKYGGFRTEMGPAPGSEIRNEDTEFGRRLLRGGEKLWYESSAVVYHEVPENRLKKEYFLRFWYDHGRATVLENKLRSGFLNPRPAWLTASKVLLKIIPKRAVCWLTAVDAKRRFYFKGMLWSAVGQVVELRRQSFSREPEAIDILSEGITAATAIVTDK
jgi:glycosyltransferase involved in cell wall biosynthesis